MELAREPATRSERLMDWIELLAGDVGPRRPCSRSERIAAQLVSERMQAEGLEPTLESFGGYSTFGLPFGLITGLAVAPAALPPRARMARSLLALTAGGALAAEGSLTHTPLSDALARQSSQNVVATIEPDGRAERTLCLMAHLDSSRSGLIFHPRVVGLLGRWIALNSALVLAGAVAEPLLGHTSRGRDALAAGRAALAAGLALLLERELRGEDVPGANDNASGCAVVLALASRIAASPLASTRVVVLLTGCEEAGTLGARAFLDRHNTGGWLFLNFDNVAGPGTVRFLTREGVISHWPADGGLCRVAAEVARRRPDLRMAPEPNPAGLTYDSSPVLARGGRALTLSVQDGFIPNLHRPTDTVENVDPGGVRRTLDAGAELIAAIDSGAAS